MREFISQCGKFAQYASHVGVKHFVADKLAHQFNETSPLRQIAVLL